MSDHPHQSADLGSVAFGPSLSQALSEGAVVQFMADPLLLPSAQRHWSTDASGTIDPGTGLYQAGRAPQGTRGKVGCALNLNGITLTDSLSVSLGAPDCEDAGEDNHWRSLKSFALSTENFNASSSILPWMYNNGKQQLHLSVELSTEIGAQDPGALDPGELKTLTLFELDSHQPLAILDATPEPILNDTAIYWAVAKVRNRYRLAVPNMPTQAEPDQAHKVNYYVHCLAPRDTKRTFYAGVRDKFGFWHYSNGSARANTAAITPLSYKPTYTVERKEIDGFDKTDEGDPARYDYNFETIEYWIFRLGSGEILSYTIKDAPRTLIKWEEDAFHVRFVSYTGVIIGGSAQTNVTFDVETLKNSGNDNIFYMFREKHWTVPTPPLDANTIAISNHRVFDVKYGDRGPAEKAQKPIELELHDHYGNSLTLDVRFKNNLSAHRGAELDCTIKDI
ncbi:hypothetical protein [Pseudomonas sp. xss_2]|uniref:hypothetical protein n=1 Tax=Pseudomonas sp. xss_2 TaxID=3367215 RepID=UPI00370B1CA1